MNKNKFGLWDYYVEKIIESVNSINADCHYYPVGFYVAMPLLKDEIKELEDFIMSGSDWDYRTEKCNFDMIEFAYETLSKSMDILNPEKERVDISEMDDAKCMASICIYYIDSRSKPYIKWYKDRYGEKISIVRPSTVEDVDKVLNETE